MGVYVPSRDRSDKKILRKKSFLNSIKEFINNSNNISRVLMGDLNILERNHIPHYSSFFEWEYDFYDDLIDKGLSLIHISCSLRSDPEFSWGGSRYAPCK